MPPAVIHRRDPNTRHRPADLTGSASPHRPHPASQVTVTVAVTLTGADAISAADDIEDGLWNLANGLSDGASVVTVATTVASVRSRDDLALPERTAAATNRAPADRPTTPTPDPWSSDGRFASPGASPTPVTAPLKLFPASRIATLDSTPVQLTRREFDMLLHMARHPGRVFTRQQLSLAVWHEDFMRGERTIDVHIHRLRLKLAGRGPTITTVRGVGYRLDAAHRVWLAEEPAGLADETTRA
jgi:DNA-binding winged helix-turn-helix (wHTH) protein